MTDRPGTATFDLPDSHGGSGAAVRSQRERAAELFPHASAAARPARRGSPDPPAALGAGHPRAGRWPAALWERVPLWVQLRCGLEPRTLAALVVVLIAACSFAVYHFWAGRPQPVRPPGREMPAAVAAPTAAVEGAEGAAKARGGGSVVVDVAGKVARPGIRRLPSGSRVADALSAAGGARPGADTTGLNRARVLTDGEHIVVGVTPAAVPPGPGGRASAGGPVSLNSATAEQLDSLPGVGPVLAQHILDYRARHGGFRKVEELRQVNGIGARRFTDLRPLVQP
ncbi:ComEA family DNA-binding protein [Streptomyces stramineus]|uniref:ComEA family DNA-binding protein n=1 Tax=Streptomyces stramineus TaxID=173861 RepID=A0ABN1AY99_9ACTN